MYIEKSDIKNKAAEDKVALAYSEAKTYKAKGELVSLETALANTIEVIKEDAVGAV